MQNAAPDTCPIYRERLAPSLWVFLAAAAGGPMIALTFTPLNSTLALILGALGTAAILGLLILLSPQVQVEGRMLYAGRARIDAQWLGEPEAFTGEDARAARGPKLPARGWHLIRGGINGVLVVPITDPDDPAPSWTISTRTPDRLAAAIRLARENAVTPAR
ncbi:DUF3093 domain-containing protein [Microbacterium keratanolyticum]